MSLVNNKMGPCLKVEHLQKLLKVNFVILMNSVGTTNGSCCSHLSINLLALNASFQDRLSPAQARLLSLKKWFGTDVNIVYACDPTWVNIGSNVFLGPVKGYLLQQQSVDIPDCEICASHQPGSLNTCKNQWLCKLIYLRILTILSTWMTATYFVVGCSTCCPCDKFAKWGWNWTLTL